jgi:hypothetical protein
MQTQRNPWGRMFARLALKDLEPKIARYNPRPAGMIQQGSATDQVFEILLANPGVYFTAGALIRLSNRSRPAVSWALLYLRAQGRVATASDDHRRVGYLRYVFKDQRHDASN